MSWFDTSKLANMANKAMKEAQKTLDTALDIKDEELKEEADKASVWNSWKMIKSDSESKLSDSSNATSASMWGSFSGSFFDAGSVGSTENKLIEDPVSIQPKKLESKEGPVASSIVTSAPTSAIPNTNSPLEISTECVAPSDSSVLGGDEALTSSWEEENKFSTSRLVVGDRDYISSTSPESPSVELVSSSEHVSNESPSPTNSQDMQTVDLASSCVSQSSIDVISPSSVELISPSDVEVISPEPYPEREAPVLSSLVSVEDSLELDSSMSSDRTVVDCQDTQDQAVCQDGMQELIEEAMVDTEKKSETSSSRSSEIVKVESLPVSEVTSCDELETGVDIDNSTTNSSDIEVISSPAVGHVTGREPVKHKLQHVRNISDQSSTHEDVNDELENLKKKNKELSELVTAREGKLMAVSREIAQLQEESGEMAVRLQDALEQAKVERIKSEEFRKESKNNENKVLVGQSEIVRLEKELAKVNQALKTAGGEDKEKDEMIQDLRSEGEALAKQNGKQAEVIRKLRSKEKGHDSEVSRLKADLDKNVNEVEKLRKSIAAKNDVEGSQSEAIKSLTDANQAWEVENKKLKNDLEDNLEKVTGLRSSLESAYREMAEMKRKLEDAAGEAAAAALSKEVSLREEAVSQLDEERRMWLLNRSKLEGQVLNLQDSLALSEQANSDREERYRQEIEQLRLRLEQSDTRHEDLAESVGLATKPLLRQIETLQANLREASSVQETVEQSLSERLKQATTSLANAQERERELQEQCRGFNVKMVSLESQVGREKEARIIAETKVDELEEKVSSLKDMKAELDSSFEDEKSNHLAQIAELKREKDFLSVNLESERLESENRKKKSLALLEQLKERDRRVKELQVELDSRFNQSKDDSATSFQSSPTPSLSQLSIAGSESFSRDPWPEEVFSSTGHTAPSLYDSVKIGSTTALMESLHAQLKLKEGELVQLQSEYSNVEKVREAMGQELTKLTIKADQNESLEKEISILKEEYHTLQQKYQTMLTMYGEKVEEAQELRLDLQDVKEMYKMQIDQLTNISKSD